MKASAPRPSALNNGWNAASVSSASASGITTLSGFVASRGHGEWPSTAARYFSDRCRHARKRITPASSNDSTLARSGITLDMSAVRAWS